MKQWVIYSDKQGSGYITDNETEIMQDIRPVNISIAGEVLTPGTLTDLTGYFTRKIKYLGIIDKNEMVFQIGTKSNLFEGTFYYQSVFKIQEDRIFEMFGNDFGRDHYFINGEWK